MCVHAVCAFVYTFVHVSAGGDRRVHAVRQSCRRMDTRRHHYRICISHYRTRITQYRTRITRGPQYRAYIGIVTVNVFVSRE